MFSVVRDVTGSFLTKNARNRRLPLELHVPMAYSVHSSLLVLSITTSVFTTL